MKKLRKLLFGLALAILVVCAMAVVLLYNPRPVFAHQVTSGNLSLLCDTEFKAQDGLAFLDAVQVRMRKSPLYKESVHYEIAVCNANWRHKFFFVANPRAGGLHYLGGHTVYLSGGILSEDRLRGPSGAIVRDERTLSYFAAHEITHACAEASVGLRHYFKLPDWIKEGYVDYVGRGSVLKRPNAIRAFVNEAPEMNQPQVAPYLRYNLLVGYMLEVDGWNPLRLHTEPLSLEQVERSAKTTWDKQTGVSQEEISHPGSSGPGDVKQY